jgi:hypothetical protein
MKRKWLKALMLAMMACASFGCPINPKEVEDLMYLMNQTRIEFTLRDEDDEGERGPTKHTLVIERLKRWIKSQARHPREGAKKAELPKLL